MTLHPDPDAADRAALRTTSRLRVRYDETDQMGVVYHANYLVWCDIGRTEYMRALGAAYADLERDGLFLAVADAALRYHAPARYDDLIRVDTWIERVQSRTITFAYEISRDDPDGPVRLVTATTRLVALDRNGRPRTLPASLQEIFRHARPTP